jgi:hypothetical protein
MAGYGTNSSPGHMLHLQQQRILIKAGNGHLRLGFECNDADWINLAHSTVHRLVAANTAMNLRVPKHVGDIRDKLSK